MIRVEYQLPKCDVRNDALATTKSHMPSPGLFLLVSFGAVVSVAWKKAVDATRERVEAA